MTKMMTAAFLAAMAFLAVPATAEEYEFNDCRSKYQSPILIPTSSGTVTRLYVNTGSSFCFRGNVGDDPIFQSTGGSDGGDTAGNSDGGDSGGGDTGGGDTGGNCGGGEGGEGGPK